MNTKIKQNKRWTLSSFVAHANKVHDDFYDYSLITEWGKIADTVPIICPDHGVFNQKAMSHILGHKCSFCANRLKSTAMMMIFDEFVSKARLIHGQKYQYDQKSYTCAADKLLITCNIHGEFNQTGSLHLQGNGCRACGIIKNTTDKTRSGDDVISEAKKLNPEYDYSETIVINSKTNMKITCPLHGEFYQTPNNHIAKRNKCPSCRGKISRSETSFFDSLSLPPSTIYNSRHIIPPYELDVYIPDKNIAIEYCGIYWHAKHTRLYHQQKMIQCQQQGIQLYTIFDSDCYHNNDVVVSSLTHKLGNTSVKIHARKCSIVTVSHKVASAFCKANHIQGYAPASVRLGLLYGDKLQALLTIGKSRFTNKYEYEIIRYCTQPNTSVIGGFSRLLTNFIKKYTPDSVVSYADLRYGTGEMYRLAGFVHSHDSQPNYWYFKKGSMVLESRIKYQKHKLVAEGADSKMTEWEIMQKQGFDRIWDCGNAVWVLTL